MESHTDNTQDSRHKTQDPRKGPGVWNLESSEWYRSAITTAIVCAVFSIIVFAFFVTNYVRGRIIDAKWEIQSENLKIELREHPEDQELLLRIRQLDLEFRQHRIRRLDFSRKGSYLLFGSVVIFLIALKFADTFKKKLPAPKVLSNRGDEQLHQATLARWAVTAALAALGSGALILAIPQDTLRWSTDIDFGGTGAAITSYPSIEQIRENWPSFRGPGGLGISAYTNIPANWNGKTGDGILWKTKIPLPGNSSPVVWGDRVFLSGGDENKLQIFCFDVVSGRLLWTGDVTRAPLKSDEEPFEVMKDTGFAAPTVVTDGRRVYAIFATGDIGCFDFNGKRIWTRSLGIPDSSYGYASSLAIYRNLVLIQYDQGGPEDEMSKLIGLDGFSGQTVWETKRPVPNSWSSPIVNKIGDQFQLLTCGDPWVIAYDPAKRIELWRAKCLAGDIAPSLIYVPHQNRQKSDSGPSDKQTALRNGDFGAGLVFAIEPYSKLVAIRPDGRGDVTETHIAWSIEEGAPDICSPVSNGELIFLLTTEGLLSCYKVADGKRLWEQDLRENFWASPSLVLAPASPDASRGNGGDKLYLLTEEGVMLIVQAGPEYKELTRCELGEECRASPAFADGRIYIRGLENLYCIGNRD
ncbi:MAG: PQQ-binding-like beta-propeller repeat protein [Phycisphaerae bacterium]